MARSGILRAGSIALGYDIITLLGQGQFGEVYEVYDRTVKRRSALKLVRVQDPITHKAAVEAQMQYLASHDNVVKLLTASEISAGAAEYVAIEMEFIPEGSLENRISQGFVGCKEAVHHIKQVLFALEHAHGHGIVHRDVKPGNIMLSKPHTKLSDFGTVIQPSSGTRVTNLFYRPHAAPEALNNQEFSELSDVYAAGLTLLRTINNIKDWSGLLAAMKDWESSAMNGKLAAKIGYAPTVPRTLRTVINRACHSNPRERFQSAAAFRGALEGLRFQNDWIRISEDEWRSVKGQRTEIVQLSAGKTFEIVYTVNNRRCNNLCRKYRREDEALSYMHSIIYNSTLA